MKAHRAASGLFLSLVATAASCATPGVVPVPMEMKGWNHGMEPFHIAGNLYYVGGTGMSSFLITSPAGHILMDSIFEADVPAIRASVEKLGFRFTDIKILIASHAHVDHVQGHPLVRKLTGARVLSSAADAPIIETGGKGDFLYDAIYRWTPCPVDGIVKDGETVELGGTKITAHLTPGHTKGATTWTMEVEEGGKKLNVVFFPSANVNPGVKLIGNKGYPGIVEDFQKSFAVWKSLPCDIFLGAHGNFFNMDKKLKRLQAGEQPNPFIDPEGYKETITKAETRFNAILASEK